MKFQVMLPCVDPSRRWPFIDSLKGRAWDDLSEVAEKIYFFDSKDSTCVIGQVGRVFTLLLARGDGAVVHVYDSRSFQELIDLVWQWYAR